MVLDFYAHKNNIQVYIPYRMIINHSGNNIKYRNKLFRN